MAGSGRDGCTQEAGVSTNSGLNTVNEMAVIQWVASRATAQSSRCEALQEIPTLCEASRHQGAERYQSIATRGTSTLLGGVSFMKCIAKLLEGESVVEESVVEGSVVEESVVEESVVDFVAGRFGIAWYR